MGKAPAFQFYANDFMDATRFWEANACGLFIRCLCIQWTQGGLPSDVRMLSKGVGMDFEEFERAWKVVASKFPVGSDGILRNSRLEDVRTRQNEISLKRSEAGKSGVLAKANASANGQAKSKQRKVKVEGEVEREEEGKERAPAKTPFDTWWTVYKKGSRKLSAEQWDRLSEPDRLACIAATPAYLKSKPDPTYRKDGERFLKHRTWEDPIVEPSTPTANGLMTKDQARAEMAAIRERLGIPPGGALETHLIPEHVRKAMSVA